MNRFTTAVIVLMLTPQLANARPWMVFNNQNQTVALLNDTGAPLAQIWIVAPEGKFQIDSALYAKFPGATFDPGDLPFAFSYINFPDTDSRYVLIGKILKPDMLATFHDFYGYYQEGFLEDPKPVGIISPEPSSCAMASLAAIAVCATSRRFSRRGKCSPISSMRRAEHGWQKSRPQPPGRG